MTVIRKTSAWSSAEIGAFLQDARIPLRLACATLDGTPLICSLWYLHDAEGLWCATQKRAHLVRLLRRDAHCGFEVAGDTMPYRGVRGQGEARLSENEGPAVLLRLIDRYLGQRDSGFARWLIARSHDEVAIHIRPAWLTSWDFSRRMTGR